MNLVAACTGSFRPGFIAQGVDFCLGGEQRAIWQRQRWVKLVRGIPVQPRPDLWPVLKDSSGRVADDDDHPAIARQHWVAAVRGGENDVYGVAGGIVRDTYGRNLGVPFHFAVMGMSVQQLRIIIQARALEGRSEVQALGKLPGDSHAHGSL